MIVVAYDLHRSDGRGLSHERIAGGLGKKERQRDPSQTLVPDGDSVSEKRLRHGTSLANGLQKNNRTDGTTILQIQGGAPPG
jgi:hypothetical protein